MEEENKKAPEGEENKNQAQAPEPLPNEIDTPHDELTSEDITSNKFNSDVLKEAINNHDKVKMTEIFDRVPDADIALAAEDLEPKELITLFRDNQSSFTAPLFDDLSQEKQEELVRAMTDKELVSLINSQSADDIADTIGDMPANLARKVLSAADKDMREDLNRLLKYKEGTAGAIMTTEYLEFKETDLVGNTIKTIRKIGKEAETVFTLFIRNSKRRFVGTVDLDDLIFAKEDQALSEIMNKDAPYCHVNTDQEEVGNMFRKYDINAMAVLNEDDCLTGIVTVDDAVDVITEETNEDFARMTNMEPTEKPYMGMSIWENARKCFPWIIGLLILGTFTTMVLNRLELQKIFVHLPILISFIPTLMDTGGNAGGQTTGMMIRSLAMNEFGPKDTLKVLWREWRSSLLIALFVSLFAFVWITIEEYTGIVSLGFVGDENGTNYDFTGYTIWNGSVFTGPLAMQFAIHALTFAALVSITMFVAVSVSKLIGTLLCMGAAGIKKDPALLAQPLLTTVMDVTTLLIYFAMACLFFPHFVS